MLGLVRGGSGSIRLAAAVAVLASLLLACAGGGRGAADSSAPPAAAGDARVAPSAEPGDRAGEGEQKGDPARDAWVVPDAMGEIYAANCAVCHGAAFEGAALGPALNASSLNHGDSLEALVGSITKGFGEKMPGWEGTLPAADIRGLAIYLMEKREGDRGDKGTGVGAPPVIPTGVLSTKLHAFRIRPVRGGLSEPYSLAALPDGRMLVTEKMRGLSIVSADGASMTLVTGTPRVWADSQLRGTAYAGMGWMHDVALHPDYAENGWIYLSFGDRCEDCNSTSRETGRPVVMVKLVRGRLRGSAWVDQQTIWAGPRESYQDGLENGAAARIAFDDAGHVFLAVGHFVDYRGVQDLDRPYGKIMRVRDDGAIPADNPFVDVEGALPAIYTLGHRVVQGLAFDGASRRVWATEHGPRGGDELNWIRAGVNYGWPVISEGVDYDGRPIHYAEELGIEVDRSTLERPRVHWTPSPGASSLVFYRGAAFPKWQDHAIVATLAKNDLWRFVLDENGEVEHETLIAGLGRFRDVTVGPKGEILLLLEHRSGSQILALEPAR
ncbi:MAG: PQQ-dependent sugar dehydrogenase [Myxococcota bacterium]